MQLENATKNSKGLQKVKPGDLNWLQLTSADSTSTINYVVNILHWSNTRRKVLQKEFQKHQ